MPLGAGELHAVHDRPVGQRKYDDSAKGIDHTDVVPDRADHDLIPPPWGVFEQVCGSARVAVNPSNPTGPARGNDRVVVRRMHGPYEVFEPFRLSLDGGKVSEKFSPDVELVVAIGADQGPTWREGEPGAEPLVPASHGEAGTGWPVPESDEGGWRSEDRPDSGR